ncbi:MAG TPA: hypothetical protein VK828_05375 [Terriglobales bacterium]|nr:hypothetical protein [Terriglobales bacterium]
MLSNPANGKQTKISGITFGVALGWIVAWAWTLLAGGGGLWLLWTKGLWPLTNGWFALLSGLSACPAIAWILRKYAGVTVSGNMRIAAAAFFFVAGRIALVLGW